MEAANNHWGNLQRGLKIVQDFGTVVRYNNVKAAIKFQFRDVDAFIHKDYRGNTDIRYISKTEKTKLSKEELDNVYKKYYDWLDANLHILNREYYNRYVK